RGAWGANQRAAPGGAPAGPFGLAPPRSLRETTGAGIDDHPQRGRATMDAKAFEAGLTAGGDQRHGTKELPPGPRADSHAHDFRVRALVLAGEITLTWNGTSRSFRAGEEFTMDAGGAHTEEGGADGVRYLVGRLIH